MEMKQLKEIVADNVTWCDENADASALRENVYDTVLENGGNRTEAIGAMQDFDCVLASVDEEGWTAADVRAWAEGKK